jgi:hypothetical protein
METEIDLNIKHEPETTTPMERADSIDVSSSVTESPPISPDPENAILPIIKRSEISIDLTKLTNGTYTYYSYSKYVVEQIVSYMYHTIENVEPVTDNGEISFHIKRRPYKYDPSDVGYGKLGFGVYRYKFQGIVMIIKYVQESKTVGTHDGPEKFESLTITTSSCLIFDKFIKLAENYIDNNDADEKKLHIYVMSKFGEWMRYNKIPSRTLDTIYFDEKTKYKFRDDITDFLSKEKEYQEFGIPYKKNYLLTGIPGSGKTSLIKGLCKEIGYNLCIFSINHDIDNHTALSAFRDIPPKSVLLIEDIDCLFEKRTGTQENKSFTFSNLINLLDGVLFRQGLITFITTNHPENMDHALLRQGRIDMIIHMNYPRKVDIKQLFRDLMKKTYSSPEEIDNQFDSFYSYIQNKTITMAGIVGFLFRYRKDWMENINEMLDADRFIKEVTKNVEDSKLYT